MEQETKVTEIDLVGLFYYLKKKIWIIVMVAVISAVIGFIYTSAFVTPQYTTETRMYVLNRTNENNLTGSDFSVSNYVLNDYKVLITGRNVTQEVIRKLNLNMPHTGLQQKIAVTIPENTRVLQIRVTDASAQRAADIANAVCDVAAVQIQQIMDVDAVKQVYAAEVPQSPSSPNVGRNTATAAFLGLLAAVGILTLIYVIDDTIRTEEDVERHLGLSVLGVIPDSSDMHVGAEASAAAKKKRSLMLRANRK